MPIAGLAGPCSGESPTPSGARNTSRTSAHVSDCTEPPPPASVPSGRAPLPRCAASVLPRRATESLRHAVVPSHDEPRRWLLGARDPRTRLALSTAFAERTTGAPAVPQRRRHPSSDAPSCTGLATP